VAEAVQAANEGAEPGEEELIPRVRTTGGLKSERSVP
jgi:hypothetical protein